MISSQLLLYVLCLALCSPSTTTPAVCVCVCVSEVLMASSCMHIYCFSIWSEWLLCPFHMCHIPVPIKMRRCVSACPLPLLLCFVCLLVLWYYLKLVLVCKYASTYSFVNKHTAYIYIYVCVVRSVRCLSSLQAVCCECAMC